MKFVCKFVAGAAHAGAVRASALDHKIGNDAVENESVIVRAFFFLAGFFVSEFLGAFGQADKIFNSLGGLLVEQLDDDVALRGFENGIGASGTSHAFSLERVEKLSHTR